MSALVEVRGRDGEMTTVVDPDAARPVAHAMACDGRGRRRGVRPEDAVPVLCPECRPTAVAARARADRLARFGRSW
jgi:hypothetical protein